MKKAYQLTPAQLKLQEERKAAKAAKALQASKEEPQIPNGAFKQRQFLRLEGENGEGKVKIMTWNMLAQTLVRRDLFPGSDCLKWTERCGMLTSELRHSSADVICLQEVDRLDQFQPYLPSYTATHARGRKKAHGLVILHQTGKFTKVGEKVVYLDEESVRDSDESKSDEWMRGGSRETKNIGLIVALKMTDGSDRGLIVATTHSFWHPRFGYERARQMGIVLKKIREYRTELGKENWNCVFAGDFNTQPTEATYCFLTNKPLPESHEIELQESRVIHISVPKITDNIAYQKQLLAASSETNGTTPVTLEANAEPDEEDDDEEGDEKEANDTPFPSDQPPPIKNSRHSVPSDGLLSTPELRSLYGWKDENEPGLISVYDSVSSKLQRPGRTIGERMSELIDGRGEPMWTSYTPLWHLTLDYIFILPPVNGNPSRITGILETFATEDLGNGLPRKGVCASDHVALVGEIEIQ